MRCKWKKSDILKLKEKAIQLDDKRTLEDVDLMLSILDPSLNFDLNKFNIVPEQPKLNYDEAYYHFFVELDTLPQNVYDYLEELFKIEPDFDYFLEQQAIRSLGMTNKDLITVGHDCISELHDKKLLDLYDELVKDENHQLHISSAYNPQGENSELDGATLYDLINNKNYIYVYKTGTACDLVTLIHETMHAYFYDKSPIEPVRTKYFSELEGRFGNLLACIYLDKIGFGDYCDEQRADELKQALKDSYKLYLNDLLFGYAKNNKFVLKDVKRHYEKDTKHKWKYSREKLVNLVSIYGFDVATDLLSYLIIQELYSKTEDIEDTYHIMSYLKDADDFDTVKDLELYDLTFMHDGFKTVNEMRKTLKKEGY